MYEKTIAYIEENGYPPLFEEITDNLNGEDLAENISILLDIAQHGISGGYGNFIYYHDTVAFFDRYEDEIMDIVDQSAIGMGYEFGFQMWDDLPINKRPATIIEIKNWCVWNVVEDIAIIVKGIVEEVEQ